jgi:hypothetical protein
VRSDHWKAVQPGAKAVWELYDLSKDVSESHDLSKENPEMLAKLQAFAKEAHTPVEEGSFQDTTLHERDKRAKFGGEDPPKKAGGKVSSLPQEGLLPNKVWKIVRASSESTGNGKLAINAIDGDPDTLWHTQFQPELARHPHELVIDLGQFAAIRGIRYLPRQDGGWNGTIADCEVSVSESPEAFSDSAASVTFKKDKSPQELIFDPVFGRYLRLRILSEVNGGPWASIAELGVVGEPAKK